MKRYSSYKDSGVEWIGEIPREWKLKPFFSICENTKLKNTISSSNVLSLSYGKIVRRDVETNKGLLPENFNSYQLIKDGFVILRFTDLQNDKNSLRVGLSKETGIITSVYLSLKPTTDDLMSEFFYLYLHSSDTQKVFYTMGGGVRQSLSFDDMRRFPVPLPPLNEQKQIVEYLDEKTTSIDTLIQSKKKKISLLKEKRTSLINQVVTKGLNPNVEMKDSGVEWIGEIPSHWTKLKLHTMVTSQLLEFQDGNHGGLHPLTEEFQEIGIPFIKPKDIQNETILWDSCDRLPLERCQEFRIGFSNNNDVLLVNRGGSIGKVVYVSDYNEEYPYFVINPQVTYLRGKNGFDSKYLFYISLSDVFQCGIDLVLGHGSTFPFLGLSNMGNFEIILPPISEQKQIVEYLDRETERIDKTVSIEQRKVEVLKEYKQSLISEVVTGKRKVMSDG